MPRRQMLRELSGREMAEWMAYLQIRDIKRQQAAALSRQMGGR